MPNDPPRSKSDAEPVASVTIAAGVVAVVAAAAIYWALSTAGLLDKLGDTAALRTSIRELGAAGPLALIAMEAVAVVLSPLPSAPVALVAGAVYGPLWGTVMIVVGAEVGAITAFLIARGIGFEMIRRWSTMQKAIAMLSDNRSQWGLMVVVFVSRLLPFVSFDAVSYAAGLTPLAFWRFAAATFAGIIPVSFLLTYAGETLAGAQSALLVTVLLVLVSVPVIAVALRALWRRFGR